MPPSLKIAINAALGDESAGGVRQFVLGLAHGLSALDDGDEEYLFLTRAGASDWLRPYLKGPCRELPGAPPPKAPPPRKRRKPAWATQLRGRWNRSSMMAALTPVALPLSDGSAERSGAKVVHFPFQRAFVTGLPSIYQPHDLQHRHYPQFFTPYQLKTREILYAEFCGRAALVVMMSKFGRRDLQKEYGIAPRKIAVIGGGSTLEAYRRPSLKEVRPCLKRFGLPQRYLFYPANTWPHKNHLGLIRALALLRDRDGLKVHAVFTGFQTEHFLNIQKEVRSLGLEDQCSFLGYLKPAELWCVLASARGLVFPSLFEGWGIPLTEAMHAGVPAAVANNGTLTEQGSDAVLGFDPQAVPSIAAGVRRLWTDDALRASLVVKAKLRVRAFRWKALAKVYRAHYRNLAGRPLNAEDSALIKRSLGAKPLS